MKKNKNIGFINLDSDLQDKISKLMSLYNGTVSGKDPTAWQTLINNVNATLKDLREMCVEEVKSTIGRINFDSAVRTQKG